MTDNNTIDIEHLREWIGRERSAEDHVSPRLAASLAAVLDEPVAFSDGDPAPTGAHWCLAPDIAPMSALGPDGHPARGEFLPPVPLPRRMWAGGELRFLDELRVGDEVCRKTRINDVSLKNGRNGALCFVVLSHVYETKRGVAIEERHDIVYRQLDAGPAQTTVSPVADEAPAADYQELIEADPVLLMRYSAATFNGHRIHYDRAYCQTQENYPGLIVHGPLQATLLLRLARRMNDGRYPQSFAFRGTSPLFDGSQFTVNGQQGEPLSLWVADAQGRRTMTASATR